MLVNAPTLAIYDTAWTDKGFTMENVMILLFDREQCQVGHHANGLKSQMILVAHISPTVNSWMEAMAEGWKLGQMDSSAHQQYASFIT